MIRFLYTLALIAISPILLFGLYRHKPNKPKFGSRWKEHFGLTPKLQHNGRPIWIHAVSVGESIAAIPLINALKAQYPEQAIVVTTTTSTGAEQIAKLGTLVEHRYMPLDFSFAVKSFINRIKPQKLLIIETELWPNTLAIVAKHNIPTIVVNARLSEKSFRNYQKVQPLFNDISKHLTLLLCQHDSDKVRFQKLGIDADKLKVTGSIKFDIQISPAVRQSVKQLREALDIERPIWIAASTHEGEDEYVLDAHQQLIKHNSGILLILVPRHPERFDKVYELAKSRSYNVVRRSENSPVSSQTQVYLGDTMGELLIMLGAADVCFMGGSLLGEKVGGHNVLEPLAMDVPTITGPSYFNFQAIVDELKMDDIVTVINNPGELSQAVLNKLSNNKPNTEWQSGTSPIETTLKYVFTGVPHSMHQDENR